MNIEELFQRILGLGESWEVVNCEYKEQWNTFYILVKETMVLWEKEKCPRCGGAAACYDHVKAMTWRHLNVFNKQSEILCELPRGRCVSCGHTYRVKPPWEGKSKHFTEEFEAFALTLMREMPMKKVGEIVDDGADAGRCSAIRQAGLAVRLIRRWLDRGKRENRVQCGVAYHIDHHERHGLRARSPAHRFQLQPMIGETFAPA